MQPRTNRALAELQPVGDLVEAEVLVVVRRHDRAVVLRELRHRGADETVALALEHGAVGRGRVRGRVGGADLLEIDALGEARALATLRAHEHQSFVGRDPEEPRAEAGVALERRDAAADLQQRALQDVGAVVVAERIARELTRHVRTDEHGQTREGLHVSSLGTRDPRGDGVVRHGPGRLQGRGHPEMT